MISRTKDSQRIRAPLFLERQKSTQGSSCARTRAIGVQNSTRVLSKDVGHAPAVAVLSIGEDYQL